MLDLGEPDHQDFYITPAALGGVRDAMLSTFIAAEVSTSFNMARTAASVFILLGIAVVVLSLFGLNLSGAQRDAARPAPQSWHSFLRLFGALTRYVNEITTSSLRALDGQALPSPEQ
ncbi:hypothetical protein [Bradyrhizobium yuanmingense]|uniref:hypothetical protein n=1 Tax=Bradyrhizobium yuanmingense TaxID=108015 RepID=UPI0023BA0AE6|nr:hypothetical protein [Bradyrhizobium yuanmingense]MDF0498873.1 hypothetical protein [Bradyrhizobium yuanmingense]